MGKMKKVALIYDFDNTLIDGFMQEENFIKMFGLESCEFWELTNKIMKENDVDPILACMYTPLYLAKEKGLVLNKTMLEEAGKKISTFYAGVEGWFDRINQFAKDLDLDVEHYIISAGYKEMLDVCKIASKFKKIFACKYMFDYNGDALWPAYLVNYTQKTQYIARIQKNLLDVLYDSDKINRKYDEKDQYVPYSNMIYFGDGGTDVPSMRMVKENGGKSICVYDPTKKHSIDIVKQLVKDDRVNCAVVADYSENTELDVWVKHFLVEIAKGKK